MVVVVVVTSDTSLEEEIEAFKFSFTVTSGSKLVAGLILGEKRYYFIDYLRLSKTLIVGTK